MAIKKKVYKKARINYVLFATVTILIILVSAIWIKDQYNFGSNKERVKVERVLDGETIILNRNRYVILANINAPKNSWCGGPEAKKLLEQLINGKNIEITVQYKDETDAERVLLYADGQLVNLELLRSGWVHYLKNGSDNRFDMSMATSEAKNSGIGLYGKCGFDIYPENGCQIRGYFNEKSNRKLYDTGYCGWNDYWATNEKNNETWFCKESDAKRAGYFKNPLCTGNEDIKIPRPKVII